MSTFRARDDEFRFVFFSTCGIFISIYSFYFYSHSVALFAFLLPIDGGYTFPFVISRYTVCFFPSLCKVFESWSGWLDGSAGRCLYTIFSLSLLNNTSVITLRIKTYNWGRPIYHKLKVYSQQNQCQCARPSFAVVVAVDHVYFFFSPPTISWLLKVIHRFMEWKKERKKNVWRSRQKSSNPLNKQWRLLERIACLAYFACKQNCAEDRREKRNEREKEKKKTPNLERTLIDVVIILKSFIFLLSHSNSASSYKWRSRRTNSNENAFDGKRLFQRTDLVFRSVLFRFFSSTSRNRPKVFDSFTFFIQSIILCLLNEPSIY